MAKFPYNPFDITAGLGAKFIKWLNSLVKDLSDDNQELKARFDEQINSVPQPSEIVDLRINDDGETFTTANNRVANLEKKTLRGSLTNAFGKIFLSVADRLASIEYEVDSRAVNVKRFGARGDGITDDITAIQAAIDFLQNGGTVYFPSGTYNVSQSVKTNDSILLKGFSAKRSILKNIGTGVTVESVGTGINDVKRYQVVKNLTISGTDKSAGGLKLKFSGEYFELKNIRVLDHINGVGIDLPDSFSGTLKNIHVSRSTNSTGIRMYGNNASTGQTTFENVVVAYSKIGIEVGEENNLTANIIDCITFTGCILQHNYSVGMKIGANVRQLKVQTTHFEWQDAAGAIGLLVKGPTAIGGDIDTCWFYQNDTAIQVDYGNNYKFHNLNIQNSKLGIYLTGNSHNNIIGDRVRFANVTEEIRDYSLDNLKITENTIMLNQGYKERDYAIVSNEKPIASMNYTPVEGSTFKLDRGLFSSFKLKTIKFRLKMEISNATAGDQLSIQLYNATNAQTLLEITGTVESDGRLIMTTPLTDFPSEAKWCNIQAKSLTVASRDFTVRKAIIIAEYV
ncbi:hypothetical protein CCZ20_24415 [Priestia aryabhattai]|uniref:glycosyl hydrolase family 28-related protein n=1 Tax=Priestia aryabhattai TaxID=412384 RepID=UPI000B50C73C|nr:glycosyl hydrolase family 28-related protein [Priestia aryabhattai]OVE34798.1 hypothetical protein CCZ20_24415 [Priestia aryabhattai]